MEWKGKDADTERRENRKTARVKTGRWGRSKMANYWYLFYPRRAQTSSVCPHGRADRNCGLLLYSPASLDAVWAV